MDLYKRVINDCIINDIVVCLKNNAPTGAVLLTYCAIDAMSFLSMPSNQKKVRSALSELLHVPIRFDYTGSQIIVYEPHLDECTLAAEEDRNGRSICSFRELDTLSNQQESE